MDKKEEAIAKVPTFNWKKECIELCLKIQVLSERAKNGDLEAIRILERNRTVLERISKLESKMKIEDISAAMENLHM